MNIEVVKTALKEVTNVDFFKEEKTIFFETKKTVGGKHVVISVSWALMLLKKWQKELRRNMGTFSRSYIFFT